MFKDVIVCRHIKELVPFWNLELKIIAVFLVLDSRSILTVSMLLQRQCCESKQLFAG